MSDAEKPSPDRPPAETPSAPPADASGGIVISIEQARAELLRKPRPRTPNQGATPPQGIARVRRTREAPVAVTLPPGEHASVIVTDTPAARAHIDKKTVHPGEAPDQTHDKKVRVKTNLDPRRAKTEISERRSSAPDLGANEIIEDPPISEDDAAPPQRDSEGDGVDSLWHGKSQPSGKSSPPSTSQPPSAMTSGPHRVSLSRPRPLPRVSRPSTPMFLLGVAVAAAIGAVVVWGLGRKKDGPEQVSPSASEAAMTAEPPVRTGRQPADSASSPATSGGATSTAGSSAAPATSEVPTAVVTAVPTAAVTNAPTALPSVSKTTQAPTTKPSSTASTAPTASAKATSTFTLPFGKEEN